MSDVQTDSQLETDEEISEDVVLLGRQFNNILKKLERGRRPNVRDIPCDIRKSGVSQKRVKAEEQPNPGKGPLCFGCEGYGHYKSECPT